MQQGRRRIYYVRRGSARHPDVPLFTNLSVLGGTVRIMDKCVHQAALESAGMKLRFLANKSGKERRYD
jgi:hypothetical protein